MAGRDVALDDWLPRYRHREIHELRIDASPEGVSAAMREVRIDEIALARLLFGLRALPARLVRRGTPSWQAGATALDVLRSMGFLVLRAGERGLVLGLAGRFWNWWKAGDVVRLDGPGAFRDFADPTCVRAAIDFTIEELPSGGCRIRTETRVEPLGSGAARRFAIYWALIRPWSGLLRHTWLRAIRRRAMAPVR